MPENDVFPQVREALDQFDSVPLEVSARRAYRIARSREDRERAHRLLLMLRDSDVSQDYRRSCAAIYEGMDDTVAEQLALHCEREDSRRRTPNRLRRSGGDEPVVLVGSISVLQSIVKGAQHILETSTSRRETEGVGTLFQRINDWNEVIERMRQWIYDYLVHTEIQMASSDVVSTVLARHRRKVDALLDIRLPEVRDQLKAALNAADEGNEESRSHVLLTCRRVIEAVADYLYPPSEQPHRSKEGTEHKVQDEHFLNRILAWADNTWNTALASALEDLSNRLDRLNDLECKGVHAKVSQAEMEFGLAQTYLLAGELLSAHQK